MSTIVGGLSALKRDRDAHEAAHRQLSDQLKQGPEGAFKSVDVVRTDVNGL